MMKNRFALLMVALIGFLGAFSANAQDDCNTNLSLFYNDAKVKNYESAYPTWKKVFDNCPQDFHVAVYAYGDKILEYKMENDAANRAEYVKLLLELYDRYHANFPTGKYEYTYAEMVIDKTKLMKQEGMLTDEELYNMYKDAFEKDKANFNSEVSLYSYFTTTVDLYKAEKLDLQTVFDTYDGVGSKIEELRNEQSEIMNPLLEAQEAGTTLTAKQEKSLGRAQKRMSNYEGISESLEAYMGQLGNCENLIPLFTKNFEANKDNEEWLNRAANAMTEKECTGDPLYARIVEKLHNLHPSAKSAKYLGVLEYKKGNNAKAKEWFKESVDLETDKFEKSKTLVTVASLSSGSTAASYAYQALKFNPSNKKAYEVIARAYAASANSCGSTPFEKRAVYWLAEEMANKAGNSSLASSYKGLAPSKSDIFNSGMAGKTIKVGCWINKSVKVPNL
ncbi:hypothetical protein [Neptunitalea lumnitzerae]|uniref:Uncharacterized protein n=1 Tax=Neptunitalea lumnitzerae TaxID=2965509 RepID=A0ABQ5MH11_9FLAO|nr:hypothetical protein [Neptunitalea sp. Y10]GLB48677.1 hypothetical protein Y10_10450 [Neptunitalea sp. Y10]